MGDVNVSINSVPVALSRNFAQRLGGAISDGQINATEMQRMQQNISSDADQDTYNLILESQQDRASITVDMDAGGTAIEPREVSFPEPAAAVGDDGEPLPGGRALAGPAAPADAGTSVQFGFQVNTEEGDTVGRLGVGIARDRGALGAAVDTNGDVTARGTYRAFDSNPRTDRAAGAILGSVLGGGQ